MLYILFPEGRSGKVQANYSPQFLESLFSFGERLEKCGITG
jgi:hypothetical protein